MRVCVAWLETGGDGQLPGIVEWKKREGMPGGEWFQGGEMVDWPEVERSAMRWLEMSGRNSNDATVLIREAIRIVGSPKPEEVT